MHSLYRKVIVDCDSVDQPLMSLLVGFVVVAAVFVSFVVVVHSPRMIVTFELEPGSPTPELLRSQEI